MSPVHLQDYTFLGLCYHSEPYNLNHFIKVYQLSQFFVWLTQFQKEFYKMINSRYTFSTPIFRRIMKEFFKIFKISIFILGEWWMLTEMLYLVIKTDFKIHNSFDFSIVFKSIRCFCCVKTSNQFLFQSYKCVMHLNFFLRYY